MPVCYVDFDSRNSRSEFVVKRFEKYLESPILDVGCYEAPIRDLIGSESYTGIDFAGKPDIVVNLEDVDRLPFDDHSFSCVLCIDVLEHLDNLHVIFSELVRVAGEHIIISLPNCWCNARRAIDRGKGRIGHYGLPKEKPADRHKWFFSLTEAREFIENNASDSGISIAEMFAAEKPRNCILRTLRRIRYPGDRYLNHYARDLWVVLKKPKIGS